MASKEEILSKLRQNVRSEKFAMPDLSNVRGIHFADKTAAFIKMSEAQGAKVEILPPDGHVDDIIRRTFPDAKSIVSNLSGITSATKNQDDTKSVYTLEDTDVTVCEGVLGVCENACVWVPQRTRQRAAYFICENLVILLDRACLVDNMHEAYRRLETENIDWGCFISGPSKTADIEQALVLGAQSARSVLVILI